MLTTTAVAPLPQRLDLANRVREFLEESDEPSPHVIARQILDTLTPREVREALAETLPAFVSTRVRLERRPVRRPTPSPAPVADQRAKSRNGGEPSSPKWAAVAAAQKRHPFDFRFPTAAGGWAFYGDFGRDDVEALVKSYQTRTRQNAAHAKRHQRVIRLMTERGVLRVKQLAANEVEEIFNA